MGASAAAPPYLKHPRRTFCQHQSSTPFLQTPRKNQWKQSYAPLAERELEESQWRSFSKDTLTVALFNSKDFFFASFTFQRYNSSQNYHKAICNSTLKLNTAYN
jgi:hypothetical protein